MPTYTVILKPDPSGAVLAEVPALDFTTEGRDEDEAVAMARDAIGGVLAALKDQGRPYPPDVAGCKLVGLQVSA